MITKAVPVVDIDLDKQRQLKFTGKAFRIIEKETGKNALQGEVWQSMSMTDLCAVLWAGLTHEDRSLTLDEASDLLHPGNQMYIMEKVTEAWVGAIPDVEEAADPLAQNLPK